MRTSTRRRAAEGKQRWHHTLHPQVHIESALNPLPKRVAHAFHPTRALLVHEVGAGSAKESGESTLREDKTQSVRGASSSLKCKDPGAKIPHHRREQKWNSRNERKHRFVATSPSTGMSKEKASITEEERREAVVPSPKDLPRSRYAGNVAIGVWHMLVRIEYWNVSWWVAQVNYV